MRLAVERATSDEYARPNFEADVAASFQHRAIGHITRRLRYAMETALKLADFGADLAEGEPRTLVLSGGVAANAELRARVQEVCDEQAAKGGPRWRLAVPPPRLCTDNGVMVGWAGVESLRRGVAHDAEGLEVRARWPIGPPLVEPELSAREKKRATAAARKQQ